MAAAVQCGADAVYLGGSEFNARRGARNFSREELLRAAEYCHARGVKLYAALNTLLSDRELPRAEEELRFLSRAGADAVIVQDLGLAAIARAAVPDLPLHGSTQMSVHSLAGVERLAGMGFRCAVLGRELDRESVRRICGSSPIPVEVFVHGALCMCVSGQCAMSAVVGRRSGNRGLCAQPCRLPYRFDGGESGRPLSLKDLCLASRLTELRDAGVEILKIEGRMKRPEYVAVVTYVYDALLREDRLPTRQELEDLEAAFSRDGFTDGYWTGKTGKAMFGVRRPDDPAPEELFRKARTLCESGTARTVPAELSAEIRAGERARLTVSDGDGHTATVLGDIPEPARTRALTEDDVRTRLSRTGGTVFRAARTAVRLDGGLALSAGSVNALRREALEKLSALRCAVPERREGPAPPMPAGERGPGEPALTVSLTRGEQLTEELADLRPAAVYLPAERMEEFDLAPHLGKTEFCVSLPRVCTDRELPALRDLLALAREKGCTGAEIGNLGLIDTAREMGFALRGGTGLNAFNSRSLQRLKDWGFVSAAVSFELRWEQIRDLIKPLPCEAIVYGRLPLMVTENCLTANALGCGKRDLRGPCRTVHVLTDRRGERFPVLPVFGCRSEIENGRVLFLADRPEYRRCGLSLGRLRFTTESPEMCARVLRRYMGRGDWVPKDCTRGLLYRGVE